MRSHGLHTGQTPSFDLWFVVMGVRPRLLQNSAPQPRDGHVPTLQGARPRGVPRIRVLHRVLGHIGCPVRRLPIPSPATGVHGGPDQCKLPGLALACLHFLLP